MGYDINRFEGDVDEELLCSICSGILENPVQAPECEHAFCSACINEWVQRQPTCPNDRNPIHPSQLKPVPRITRNLLARLNITCDNEPSGCTAIVKLDQLNAHVTECEFNPKKPVPCVTGCGMMVPKDEMSEHNCIRELRNIVENQQQTIGDLQLELADHRLLLNEHKRDLILLKDCMRTMRGNYPQMRQLQTEMEQDEILRWCETLTPARVTRWGGMISTPDAVLQAVIKRALIESGCPSHAVNDLMENAHERKWPCGLSTLETRQLHRRQYENYVSKRIPGKQAVIIASCENSHMPPDMIVDPGIVMIFAHGVE